MVFFEENFIQVVLTLVLDALLVVRMDFRSKGTIETLVLQVKHAGVEIVIEKRHETTVTIISQMSTVRFFCKSDLRK